METNGNGNGLIKPIVVGVAICVLAAVVIGSGGTTIANTVAQAEQKVQVTALKEAVEEQQELTQGIDVMAEQIDDIKQDVQTILQKLDK